MYGTFVINGHDYELWEIEMDASVMISAANLDRGRHFALANPGTMRSPKSNFNGRRPNQLLAWNVQSIGREVPSMPDPK
jgi:hypothetical protein